MRIPYEKGVAIHSAPSFALGVARPGLAQSEALRLMAVTLGQGSQSILSKDESFRK